MKLRSMSLFCGLFAGLVLTAPAYAAKAGDVEVGAQYVFAKYTESSLPNFNSKVLMVHGDYYLNKNISLQGRLGVGVSSTATTYQGVSYNIKAKHIYGLYVAGHLPINSAFEAYGMLGWASINAETSSNLYATVSGTDNGFSYGAGLRYHANKRWSGELEFASYYEKSGTIYSGIGVGVGYRF